VQELRSYSSKTSEQKPSRKKVFIKTYQALIPTSAKPELSISQRLCLLKLSAEKGD
jgi:hypothetical protein